MKILLDTHILIWAICDGSKLSDKAKSLIESAGNGRMSRLLSLLLLYKNGFDAGKYISFEEQINRRKANYYEALRQSSVGWQEGRNSYFPFMEDFLFTLYLCYKELEARFGVVQDKKSD